MFRSASGYLVVPDKRLAELKFHVPTALIELMSRTSSWILRRTGSFP